MHPTEVDADQGWPFAYFADAHQWPCGHFQMRLTYVGLPVPKLSASKKRKNFVQQHSESKQQIKIYICIYVDNVDEIFICIRIFVNMRIIRMKCIFPHPHGHP